MCVTHDDGTIFTTGEDGTLYIYEVRGRARLFERFSGSAY